MHVIVGDLREAGNAKPSGERLTQDRLDASSVGLNLTLDEHGFLWRQPPPTSIAHVVQAQRDRDAALAGEREERRRARQRGRTDQPEGEIEGNITPERQVGPAHSLRKRSGKSMAETSSPGPATPPPVKKPKLDAPSPGARETVDMDKVLGKLNVISTQTARRRATSLQREGRSASQPLIPDRMTIPGQNT